MTIIDSTLFCLLTHQKKIFTWTAAAPTCVRMRILILIHHFYAIKRKKTRKIYDEVVWWWCHVGSYLTLPSTVVCCEGVRNWTRKRRNVFQSFGFRIDLGLGRGHIYYREIYLTNHTSLGGFFGATLSNVCARVPSFLRHILGKRIFFCSQLIYLVIYTEYRI